MTASSSEPGHSDGSDDPWDDAAPEWDQNEAVRAYAAAAFESLQGVLADLDMTLKGGHSLDFGCGTGLLTERMVAEGATVHAVDTSSAMLEIVRSKAADRGWTNVTTSAVVPTSGRHDLITCSSVCGFLDDYPGTAAALTRLLRPGGLFIQWDWERDPDDDDAHGLDRVSIRDALTTAGLESITVRQAFAVTVDDQTMRPLMGFGTRPL